VKDLNNETLRALKSDKYVVQLEDVMFERLKRYFHWLHGQWPAGHVEKLPETDEMGRTNTPGVYVVGDLKGVPLLKFSVDSGARAIRTILADQNFQAFRKEGGSEVYDVVIIGAGVSGMSAALEARKAGLKFIVLEASEPFSTVVNFPKGKPIFTYPNDMVPTGDLVVSAQVKEPLVDELRRQTREIETRSSFAECIKRQGKFLEVVLRGENGLRARQVIVGIGRSGNFRKLGVPGEDLDKVYNRLHDPKDFSKKSVMVVGGGDSAMETAIALVRAGAKVCLSYRKKEFARAKPENIEMVLSLAKDPSLNVSVPNPVSERVTTAAGDFMGETGTGGSLSLFMGSALKSITPTHVVISIDGKEQTIPNDVVFTMIGREAPLDFFRRSGIKISGEFSTVNYVGMGAFLLFCTALYNWKSGGSLSDLFYRRGWFPTSIPKIFAEQVQHPENLLGTILISASSPSFWYTLAYSIIVFVFGLKRIKRRKTPYVTLQTSVLMSIQILPLFLLPEIILPWLGYHHLIPRIIADHLFPVANYGHGREYWRSYGFVLAWPLMVYNVFTNQPLSWWLVISAVQTFVIIPGLIYFYGKGAYCGWICSCGALAETLGDNQRTKMPHGPGWNKLNMLGQGVLAIAFLLLAARILGWLLPGGNWIDRIFGNEILHTYKWTVDVGLAGILGYGLYFWYSGRMWCRFACPLAALMHFYSRFSRFGIVANKKKCISCNVCTSVCHQGIDIMNFANKGLPMKDPECVRCCACVQSCPTGVLTFGQVTKTGSVIRLDRLSASSVQMKEGSGH